MRACVLACFVLVGGVLVGGMRAAASDPAQSGTMEEFRPAVQTIAKGVAKVLKSRRLSEVTVSSFTGPPTLGTASGPGLRQLFVEELGNLSVRTAKLGTEMGLSGEYQLAKAFPADPAFQVRLEVRMFDSSGQVVTDLSSAVDGSRPDDAPSPAKRGKVIVDTHSTPEATALAMGMTVDFDLYQGENGYGPPADPLAEALANPTAVVVKGNQLRASPTSPYGLEVVVGGRPRPLSIEDGRAFVTLAKGDSFSLRLVNDAPFYVASIFTLDGVNSFSFSDVKMMGRPKYTRWVVGPSHPFELKGWHKNNQNVLAFKVTDFAESAAALVGAEGQLGTISVVVRATWPLGQSPPSDEMPQSFGAGYGASEPQAIGFGEVVDQRVQEDSSRREFGRVRSIMTIRYEKPE